MVTENTEPMEDGATPVAEVEVQAESATPARLFSQEDVNRIQAQTRREVRGQFSDYQQLKNRAAKADELEQANLTEAERLAQRANDAEKAVVDANVKLADALISSEVKVKAVQLGIIDPDAAYLLMDKANVQYDAEKGVSGIDEALTQLLDNKPYLKGSLNRAPNLNPQSGEPAPILRLSEGQREAARLMGMSEEEYAQGI
jgi:FKBP-type peptidyl-prolyl cis-trans isomerase (trigger factor)